jgi:hypothetical protein
MTTFKFYDHMKNSMTTFLLSLSLSLSLLLFSKMSNDPTSEPTTAAAKTSMIGVRKIAKQLTHKFSTKAIKDIAGAKDKAEISLRFKRVTYTNSIRLIYQAFTKYSMFGTHAVVFDEAQLIDQTLNGAEKKDVVVFGSLDVLLRSIDHFDQIVMDVQDGWQKHKLKDPYGLFVILRQDDADEIVFDTHFMAPPPKLDDTSSSSSSSCSSIPEEEELLEDIFDPTLSDDIVILSRNSGEYVIDITPVGSTVPIPEEERAPFVEACVTSMQQKTVSRQPTIKRIQTMFRPGEFNTLVYQAMLSLAKYNMFHTGIMYFDEPASKLAKQQGKQPIIRCGPLDSLSRDVPEIRIVQAQLKKMFKDIPGSERMMKLLFRVDSGQFEGMVVMPDGVVVVPEGEAMPEGYSEMKESVENIKSCAISPHATDDEVRQHLAQTQAEPSSAKKVNNNKKKKKNENNENKKNR